MQKKALQTQMGAAHLKKVQMLGEKNVPRKYSGKKDGQQRRNTREAVKGKKGRSESDGQMVTEGLDYSLVPVQLFF